MKNCVDFVGNNDNRQTNDDKNFISEDEIRVNQISKSDCSIRRNNGEGKVTVL